MEEKDLLKSADNSILLTTHRLIETTATSNREVFLKDIISYEVIYRKQTYYIILSCVFAVLILFFAVAITKEAAFVERMSPAERSTVWGVLISLEAISLYLTFFSVIKNLKITGKHNTMELNVDGFRKENLNKFVSVMREESDKRKRE